MDELEEFSEAPHVVNNCSISGGSQPPSGRGLVPGGAVKAMNGANHQHSINRNGYTQKTLVSNGGVNLMDADAEEEEDEIVINEFRRQGTRQSNGKVMMNGDDEEGEEENNEEEYEHISLSDHGLTRHGNVTSGGVIVGSDIISTDLLNCDDEDDQDLLILTNSKNIGHRGDNFRMFVNT